MTLYTELDERLVESNLDNEAPDLIFLPLSDLDEMITKDIIRTQLPDQLRDPGLPDKVFLQAKKVFAILALIEEPSAIGDLIQQDDLTDADLPLSRKAAKKGHRDYNVLVSACGDKLFSSFASWPRASSVGQFLDKQWAFQAPVLDSIGQHIVLEPKCPLPLTESLRRSAGGSGVVYQSKFHPAHQQIFKTEFEPYIALKEVGVEKSFDIEKENLERIQNLQHKHLIQLIATCERKPFFYFIFPWADGGNLKEFWKREDSKPRAPELILWSLQQMLGLVDAVKALHGENIRHGDLKPQNILHFKECGDDTDKSGGEGILVIADVGVSKFHREVTSMRHVATFTTAATASYEAPEAELDRHEGKPRPRRYDMWSMGCMFLEFTIWLVYSYNAVRRFRGRRTSKGDSTTGAWTFFTRNDQGAAEIHSGVFEAIRILCQDPRCKGGTALESLILLIKEHLLQIDVQQRAEAPELHEKLEKIVRAAEENPPYLFNKVDPPPPTPGFFRSRKDSGYEPTVSLNPRVSQGSFSTLLAENSPNGGAHMWSEI